MIARSSTLQSLLLAGMLGALLVAPPAFAQQPADQPSTQPAAPPAQPAEQPSTQPAAPPATSQPPAAPAAPMPIQQPQPTSVPGRPDIPNAEVATQLRGVPPPPFPTPEDKLPIPQLKLPRLSGILRSVKLLYYQRLMSTDRRSNILRSESSGAPDF
jgi:hypothetical protein